MSFRPDLARRPRTRRVFSDADMARMSALYYDPAVPLIKVAAEFGVPVSTFLRWIAEMDWPRRSAQAAAANPRRDLFAEAQERRDAARATGKPRGKPAAPVDPVDLAGDVAAAARAELDALRAEPAPKDFAARRRRAAVLDQLSRAVRRMQRLERARTESWEDLEKATLALARAARRPANPQTRKRPGPVIRAYGADGKPEGGW